MKKVYEQYEVSASARQKSMKNVQAMLLPNEFIVAETRPHKPAFVLNRILKDILFVLLWIAFDSAFIVLMVVFNVLAEEPGLLGFVIPFFALHLLPVWMWIFNFFKAFRMAKHTIYIFTDQRLITQTYKKGILLEATPYKNISAIDVRIGRIDKMFQVGDITLVGPAWKYTIEDIKDVMKTYHLLQNYMQGLDANSTDELNTIFR